MIFQNCLIKLKTIFSYKTMLIIGIVIIFIITAIIFLSQKEKHVGTGSVNSNIKKYGVLNSPEFLNEEEKRNLNISQDLKVQALKRNQKGVPAVYKIIKNESDIVNNPTLIKPVNPLKATPTN